MRVLSPSAHRPLRAVRDGADVNEPSAKRHTGPIAAVVVACIFLGGGLVGALELGSFPAAQAPAVLAVSANTPRPGPLPASTSGAPTISPAPPTPPPSAPSSTPAVVAPNRQVVIFAPPRPASPGDTPDPQSSDSAPPTDG